MALAAVTAWGGEWQFHFDGPLKAWKNGLPVGNGRIGAQAWGSGEALYLTLDRGDVWDLRYQENHQDTFAWKRLRQLVAERNKAGIQKEMSPDVSPTNQITPTRVSIGRLRVGLPAATTVEWAELDMRRAEVRWRLRVNGQAVDYRVLACLDPDVMLVTLNGVKGWTPEVKLEALGDLNSKLATTLGYPAAERGAEGEYAWVRQSMGVSGAVTTVWTARREGEEWTLLLTIPRQDSEEALAEAKRTLAEARRRGVARLVEEHREWWERRWARSEVEIPQPELKRLWINGIYKLASSSYGGAPANLQGLWPPDGEIPPWRGDYHLDMNVQQTYWPVYSSNQLDLAEPLERWLTESVVPESEKLTRRFFGVEGMWICTMLDRKGRALGGENNWMTAQYWMGAAPWMAQHVWWQYSYGQDREYLRERGYPFLKKTVRFFENVLEEGADGKLHVPLSISPEYYSNDLTAWTKDPTCDLALVRNLLRYARRAAEALGVDADKRALWQRMEERLAPYPVGGAGLKVQPDSEYDRSHRHPMHLFPIFPGEDLNIEGSESDQRLIARSIRHWVFRGTGEWTGWSFPYGSLIASRVGRGNHALHLLEAYESAYIWPNGFHVNGDYKRYGYSLADYEPFTMEAECGFTAAVNEMLMQSWGGKVRVFPAMPEKWRDVRFRDLRAEGGFLVSAEMRHGEVVSVVVRSEKGGETEVVWPSGRAKVKLGPGEWRELAVR
jgi:alpha-L-fucosidase 2